MDNISRILREEIDRFILKEAVDVRQLSKYIRPLEQCNAAISSASGDENVNNFLKSLSTYIIQIIFAIKRCISANSLNEAFNFSDYGINYPAELGGNFFNSFEQNFYKGAGYVGRKLGNNNGNNANGNAYVNPNTVQSVKLSQLLNNYQRYVTSYQRINANGALNAIFGVSHAPYYALTQIGNLKQEYETMINAQGTNP